MYGHAPTWAYRSYVPDHATFYWVQVPRQESERSCIIVVKELRLKMVRQDPVMSALSITKGLCAWITH
jgi:hypothetical protein